MQKYDYDIALSFAGEDRQYVEKVAEYIKSHGVHVFYDSYENVNLWGKNLFIHLMDVYQNRARFCVVFISKHYKEKLWTMHELKAAFARAFESSGEYILPARFDDTVIPGIPSTINFLDLNKLSPIDLGQAIIKKVSDAGEHTQAYLHLLFKEGQYHESNVELKIIGVDISNRGFVVGRNDFFCSPLISRKHALITEIAGKYYVADLHSSTGTAVNHVKIPHTPVAIHDGDIITFANVDYLFRIR